MKVNKRGRENARGQVNDCLIKVITYQTSVSCSSRFFCLVNRLKTKTVVIPSRPLYRRVVLKILKVYNNVVYEYDSICSRCSLNKIFTVKKNIYRTYHKSIFWVFIFLFCLEYKECSERQLCCQSCNKNYFVKVKIRYCKLT